MHQLIITFLLVFILFTLSKSYQKNNNQEDYSLTTPQGKLCTDCAGKNLNACLDCFNCGYCIDDWGNGYCVPGDYKGPYNFDKCKYYIQGDPFRRMLTRNRNYKCNYGPTNASRAISANI